jgi:hypothetical protein
MQRALISFTQPDGPNGIGQRVCEVVNPGEEFEVSPTILKWVDCPDGTLPLGKSWYNPANGQFKKTFHGVDATENAGNLALDENNIPTQYYLWSWDNENWTIEEGASPAGDYQYIPNMPPPG